MPSIIIEEEGIQEVQKTLLLTDKEVNRAVYKAGKQVRTFITREVKWRMRDWIGLNNVGIKARLRKSTKRVWIGANPCPPRYFRKKTSKAVKVGRKSAGFRFKGIYYPTGFKAKGKLFYRVPGSKEIRQIFVPISLQVDEIVDAVLPMAKEFYYKEYQRQANDMLSKGRPDVDKRINKGRTPDPLSGIKYIRSVGYFGR